MKENNDLLYSSEASAARTLLYQDLNEINLFVEDRGKEYEYETIFKRLLENKYKISAIFSTDGKNNAKERYKEFGDSLGGVRNFYIVDGDFDRIVNPLGMIEDRCFIYLKTYNIENYFIDKHACQQFAKRYLKCMDNDVEKKVDFDSWKTRIVQEAKKLFWCYCFVQKNLIDLPNVARKPYEFIDANNGFERKDGAYQAYLNKVMEKDSEAEKKILEMEESYQQVIGEPYCFICGKFLLCSLYCYLKSVIGKSFSRDDLRWHLIDHFDVSRLNYIKEILLDDLSATDKQSAVNRETNP